MKLKTKKRKYYFIKEKWRCQVTSETYKLSFLGKAGEFTARYKTEQDPSRGKVQKTGQKGEESKGEEENETEMKEDILSSTLLKR